MVYALVFLGVVLEGDAVVFGAMFLARQGYFDLESIITVIFIAGLLSNGVWYWIGLRLSVVSVWIAHWMNRLGGSLDDHLRKRLLRTIFISKFAYGLHHLVLMRAGALKISFAAYFKDTAIATVVWLFAIGSLGYLSSGSFHFIKRSLHVVEVVMLLAVMVFLCGERLVSKFLRKKI